MKKIVTVIVTVSLLLLVSASAPTTSNAAERQEEVEGEREQQQALQMARAAVEAARVLWERTLRVSEGNMSTHVVVLLGKPHNAGLQNNGSAWYRYQAGGLHVTILFNRDKVEKIDIVSRPTAVTRAHLAEVVSIFRQSEENAKLMDQGVTPLHFFAEAGDVDRIKLLVFAGVNVNATCREGSTPLHWAVREGEGEVARFLISVGANVNARTRHGQTPLHFAAIEGDVRIARLLVSAGASVNVTTERNGVTPLGFAIGLRNTEMIRYLRSVGARDATR